MKKIGFIDYYLDEWHANNYPEYIAKASEGRYKVCYAYGKIDSPLEGGMTNKEWAEKQGVELLDSIEEVIEKSDYLIVLSPDNPEMHEELCQLPLRSGKLTYVDKTFAPDKATALRIFAIAEEHGTPCYSSSALRFCTEWKDIDKADIDKIYSEGPYEFDRYGIHQIEPIVLLMNCPAKRVMALDTDKHPQVLIEFEDGRKAVVTNFYDDITGFTHKIVNAKNESITIPVESDYFALFIDNLVEYFDSGVASVSHEQTIDVIGIIEAGVKALANPYTWYEV